MDIQQLKLLAARLRVLLEQLNHIVGHNQSLDLIASIPGLRNWPEVQAFPNRLTTTELDITSTSRLAFRLQKKFGIELTSKAVLEFLSPATNHSVIPTPQIWPTGPQPGVYVTLSQNAIDALLENYEEATDGALVYAEDAGSHWETSIDLGDDGLWSKGLERVPSGTLIVVGPIKLNQQEWERSSLRLEMACLTAEISGHRVAVLVDTPVPETVYEDIQLMVQGIQSDDAKNETALIGRVTDNGEMQRTDPFANPWPVISRVPTLATPDAIPLSVRQILRDKLSLHSSGILLFGARSRN